MRVNVIRYSLLSVVLGGFILVFFTWYAPYRPHVQQGLTHSGDSERAHHEAGPETAFQGAKRSSYAAVAQDPFHVLLALGIVLAAVADRVWAVRRTARADEEIFMRAVERLRRQPSLGEVRR